MKTATRILLAAALVLFGNAAWPFADGFEAHALEPSSIKAISIDAAPAIPVQNVKVDAAGLLTAVKVGPPIPPVPSCKPTPAGFTVIEKPWSTLVGATYPNSPSWLQPIGSWTERTSSQRGGKPAAGKLYTAKFTADTGLHKVDWLGAQAVYAAGYLSPQSASEVYVAVSPCRGDAQSACSTRARSSALFYGTRANVAACVVTPGQTYYLTVGFFPASLDPKANTCAPRNPSSGVLCDANFQAH